MLDIGQGEKYSGKFNLDGKQIDGELTFDASRTNLYLHHPEHFSPIAATEYVLGTLRDLTNVSLFNCVGASVPGSSFSEQGAYYFATLEPHFVLYGRQHLRPAAKRIRKIRVVLADAPYIFPDYGTFSTVIRPTSRQIRSLVKANAKIAGRSAAVGRGPIIAYFTGKQEIFKAKTVLGTISAEHSPSFGMGSPEGISIKNKIVLQIAFPKAVAFHGAIDSLLTVLQFMELIAGRRQVIQHLGVDLKARRDSKSFLQVYWTWPPHRKVEPGERKPHVIDLPINAAAEPEVFANVLSNWLARHNRWREARLRFSGCFSEENVFGYDRLIGAANMFDLLPPSAIPSSTILSDELRTARESARQMFKALPASPERDSVLNALARVGKASLKRKVRHRARPVVDALGSKLPRLIDVLDLSIDARNFYVHGSESEIDYDGNFFAIVPFLTRSLEFVFAASDLIEAGWAVRDWLRDGSTHSHPFASFVGLYRSELERLQEAIPDGHRLNKSRN